MRAYVVVGALAAALVAASWPGEARAIPAFARKYETSCLTCHTVFPKLNPFGEAFRRNGYLFPEHDPDYVKEPTVALGRKAYEKIFPKAVWPSTLPANVPLAAGFDGQISLHPDTSSGGAQAADGTVFSLQDLVGEGVIWAGGSFDDEITFFGAFSVSEEGAEVEHAIVLFDSLFFPGHALNLRVGRQIPTLTSWGAHSSYLVDMAVAPLPVTALYGAGSDSFDPTSGYNGLQLDGILGGRVDYSVGVNAGANVGIQPSENAYGHVGVKIGGMRLDGVGGLTPKNPMRPWEETALTLDLFAYHSRSRFEDSGGTLRHDVGLAYGGGLRATWGSLELDAGLYRSRHDRADGGGEVRALVQYDELSYLVYPWMVPAVRVEWYRLEGRSGAPVTDLRILPGIAFLVRANLKVTLLGWIERASGAPPAGWEPVMGMALPGSGTAGPELEALTVGLAYAF